MKKVMKKSVVLFCLVAGGVFAAEKKTAKPELVATVELAPFGDISKKVVELGTMVNNPLLPALLIGAGQERLAQTYGRFRSDAPMYGFVYASTTDDTEIVVVYPSVDGPAQMLLGHPGATKDDDGMLHLPADEQNPDARAVMFTGDRRFCAIAPSAVLARRALEDFAARAVRTASVRPPVIIATSYPSFTASCMAYPSLMFTVRRGSPSAERVIVSADSTPSTSNTTARIFFKS